MGNLRVPYVLFALVVGGAGCRTQGVDRAGTPKSVAAAATASPSKGVIAIAAIAAIKYDGDDQFLAALRKLLQPLPGLEVEMSVMDVPGEVETEEGYFSVTRGETEVLRVMRPSEIPGDGIEVHALGPMFATTDGIKPGDKAATLGAKRKDVGCSASNDRALGVLVCRGRTDSTDTFVLDATGYKGKLSSTSVPVELSEVAGRTIVEIVR